MRVFNEKYIWRLYDGMCQYGKGTQTIPDTNYRIKEIDAYHVKIQVEQLYALKDGALKSRWVDTGEEYKVNILNSKEWDAMFDESEYL